LLKIRLEIAGRTRPKKGIKISLLEIWRFRVSLLHNSEVLWKRKNNFFKNS
jgi:hypothetical protein